jgi:hypothetical protein
MILMLAAMSTLTHIKAEPDATDLTVPVCVPEGINYQGLNLFTAEGIASKMFLQAGVRIRWLAGQSNLRQRQPVIVLSLTSDTPENIAPNIFAYAQVFEGVHIRIFADHVAERVHRVISLGTALLAHVMVHEITHMLQGVNRHSEEGIMKATWAQTEVRRMVVAPLRFSAEDVRLIHTGLAARPRPLNQSLTSATSKERSCFKP